MPLRALEGLGPSLGPNLKKLGSYWHAPPTKHNLGWKGVQPPQRIGFNDICRLLCWPQAGIWHSDLQENMHTDGVWCPTAKNHFRKPVLLIVAVFFCNALSTHKIHKGKVHKYCSVMVPGIMHWMGCGHDTEAIPSESPPTILHHPRGHWVQNRKCSHQSPFQKL